MCLHPCRPMSCDWNTSAPVSHSWGFRGSREISQWWEKGCYFDQYMGLHMSTVAGWFPATHIGLLLSTKNTCSDSPHSLLLSICLSLCVPLVCFRLLQTQLQSQYLNLFLQHFMCMKWSAAVLAIFDHPLVTLVWGCGICVFVVELKLPCSCWAALSVAFTS